MPNETALGPVQAAIYSVLSSDAQLGALLGPDSVLDDVPEEKTYPYITIGEAVETPDNDHGGFASRVAATLHIWSEHRGYSEGLAIANHLMRLLDHQSVDVTGRGLVACRHEQTVTMRDPDPDVRHVVVRFSFDTHQI